MILITGPTGSGKTSTLYASLKLKNDPSLNIVTVEDPIEYQVPGITQVQVNNQAGLSFSSALRAFLRQDPDVIMVGEIRDLTTAETAVQAAQSGHLVLSTLHTNSAPSTLSRMILLGIEPHQIGGALLCVIAQRLVRKICPECIEETPLKREHQVLLDLAAEQIKPEKLFTGKGCEACEGTGYKGRTGLYEILSMTSAIRLQIVLDSTEEALWEVARREGMRTLLEDGIEKVEQGITTMDEVLRVLTIRRRASSPKAPEETEVSSVVSPEPSPVVVQDVMTKNVVTVHPLASSRETMNLLLRRGISGCPVVNEKGRVIGLISFSDLATSVIAHTPQAATKTVRDVMSSKQVISVKPTDTLEVAAEKLVRHKVRRLVVLHEENLVGILTPYDLIPRPHST